MDPSLYLDRDTWVHRLDPRTKMLLLLGDVRARRSFSSTRSTGSVVLAMVLASGMLAKSLVNLRRIWFILLMIAVDDRHPVVHRRQRRDAAVLASWSGRRCSTGIGAALRIDIMIVAGMIFLSTTRNEEVATRAGPARDPVPLRLRRLDGLAARPDDSRDGPDDRPGPALARARPGVRKHHPANPQEHAFACPGLRLDGPLDQRLLHGAGVEGLRGGPAAHILPQDRS